MKRILPILPIILVIILLFISCSEKEKFKLENRDNLKVIEESEVFEINLAGELAQPDAEISGLAWYNNNLILLPQFPYKFGNGLHGSLYYLSKEKLRRTISSKSKVPLTSLRLEFDAAGLDKFNWWGSGYEGIIFVGDDVYLIIENFKEKTEGFIVKGEIDFPNKKIKIDPLSLIKINIPNILRNLSEEAVTYFNNQIYIIHEINGINVNPNPFAILLSTDLLTQKQVNFPTLEYRVTDATMVEPDSTFWVINYLWTGDINKLKPQNDFYFNEYGIGRSHKDSYSVERLLKLKITPDGIIPALNPPIYLKIEENMSSRNWEGIVKFDEIGFLLATDKFPRTILGFIPYSE